MFKMFVVQTVALTFRQKSILYEWSQIYSLFHIIFSISFSIITTKRWYHRCCYKTFLRKLFYTREVLQAQGVYLKLLYISKVIWIFLNTSNTNSKFFESYSKNFEFIILLLFIISKFALWHSHFMLQLKHPQFML